MFLKKNTKSWGGVDQAFSKLITPSSKKEVLFELSSKKNILPFGFGKSYGDVCLSNNGSLISMRNFCDVIDFDKDKGIINCKAGISLKDIQNFVIPNGWMLPVVPGSQYISLGGAVASDVHGKNHHIFGSFGNHLSELILLRSDGSEYRCSLDENKNFFKATIGGIGLTGIILSAKIKLAPLKFKNVRIIHKNFNSLESYHELSQEFADQDYRVAWINCKLNKKFKGVMQLSSFHDFKKEIKVKNSLKVPLPKAKFINTHTKKLFNSCYSIYYRSLESRISYDHFQNFLHPLDRVSNWNDFYGKNGFYQFQCYLSFLSWIDPLQKITNLINNSNIVPFLPVLKSFGKTEGLGLLSFPKEGITFSVDIENNGIESIKLIRKLNDICIDAGGRIYLAKDGLMSEKNFKNSYPLYQKFLKYRDPKMSSLLSRRLMGY